MQQKNMSAISDIISIYYKHLRFTLAYQISYYINVILRFHCIACFLMNANTFRLAALKQV